MVDAMDGTTPLWISLWLANVVRSATALVLRTTLRSLRALTTTNAHDGKGNTERLEFGKVTLELGAVAQLLESNLILGEEVVRTASALAVLVRVECGWGRVGRHRGGENGMGCGLDVGERLVYGRPEPDPYTSKLMCACLSGRAFAIGGRRERERREDACLPVLARRPGLTTSSRCAIAHPWRHFLPRDASKSDYTAVADDGPDPQDRMVKRHGAPAARYRGQQ